MANILNDIDELIGKYLAQEASAEERAQVEIWLAQNEANRHYFDQFKLIFDNAATVKNLPQFDTDTAWNKVRSRLHGRENGKTIALDPPDAFNRYWKIAASVLLVMGIGFFAYRFLRQPEAYRPMEIATKAQTEADTLPDGSNIFLNKETRLSYSFDKKKKTRIVKLKGEAYFDISPAADKAFIIDVDGILIKDIGTSFNVKAYPESNTIEVVVEEGEVIFYTENNPGITLQVGDKGIYYKTSKTFAKEQAEANATAYKSKQFNFSDSNLGDIVSQLNSVYEKQIIIGSHLRKCRLTVSFHNEDIDEIANVIGETLGLTVKSSDQEIVLEGKGCEE